MIELIYSSIESLEGFPARFFEWKMISFEV